MKLLAFCLRWHGLFRASRFKQQKLRGKNDEEREEYKKYRAGKNDEEEPRKKIEFDCNLMVK